MQTADTCISCQEGGVEQLLPHRGQGGAEARPTRRRGFKECNTGVGMPPPPLRSHYCWWAQDERGVFPADFPVRR